MKTIIIAIVTLISLSISTTHLSAQTITPKCITTFTLKKAFSKETAITIQRFENQMGINKIYYLTDSTGEKLANTPAVKSKYGKHLIMTEKPFIVEVKDDKFGKKTVTRYSPDYNQEGYANYVLTFTEDYKIWVGTK